MTTLTDGGGSEAPTGRQAEGQFEFDAWLPVRRTDLPREPGVRCPTSFFTLAPRQSGGQAEDADPFHFHRTAWRPQVTQKNRGDCWY
jgi:hypothetical protein